MMSYRKIISSSLARMGKKEDEGTLSRLDPLLRAYTLSRRVSDNSAATGRAK
jgi:hypothetical protein